MKPPLPKGTRVRILNSTHPDIPNGTEGVVDQPHENGYGVAVTANFTVLGKSGEQTRVVWFKSSEVEEVK